MFALAGRSTNFKGVRLFDPGRDLASVARLLEEPFRPDSSFRFPCVPLVCVARPGPEARRGGRMVGTLGQSEGKPAAHQNRERTQLKTGRMSLCSFSD